MNEPIIPAHNAIANKNFHPLVRAALRVNDLLRRNLPQDETLYESALIYQDEGLYIFPTGRNKRPIPYLTQRGCLDATNDLDTIKRWFSEPGRGIGFPTGERNDATVIDVDMGQGKFGSASFQKACGEDGEPQTLMAHTGGGGLHYFFNYAGSAVPSKNNFLYKHVDCKNNGGYVILAPSSHPSGNRYLWEEDPHSLLHLPVYLCRELREGRDDKKRNYQAPPIEWLPDMLKACNFEDRDIWLGSFRICGRIYKQNPAVYQVLLERNKDYKGKREPGDDQRQWQAFFEDSKKDPVGRQPQTAASLYKWARAGDWKPPVPSIANLDAAVQVMEDEPELCDVWHDQFLLRNLTGNPPREWTADDDLGLLLKFQREKRMPKMALNTVTDAVEIIAKGRPRHQVRDYLDDLEWDEEPRLDELFIKYFGADDTPYARAAGKNFVISMVARADRPGCQVDHMPVLEGSQGIFKSSAARVLGGEWYTEQHEKVTSKDFYQNIQGKWLVEIVEMHSFTSAGTMEKVKSVITTLVDRFRPSYGRRAADYPRQCVFIGTTNHTDWNHDDTGARRFWPIRCKDNCIDLDGLKRDRDQLFAEAVHRYRAGEPWWEMPLEETRQQQADRYSPPALVEPIARYIYDPTFDGPNGSQKVPRTQLTMAEVLEHALQIPPGQWHTNQREVMKALKHLGWKSGERARKDGERLRIWVPADDVAELVRVGLASKWPRTDPGGDRR